jgi:ABC-2 type transport system permease protein
VTTALEATTVPPQDGVFHAERSPFAWLFEREVLRFLRIWRYSVLGPVLATLLFVIVFGTALGRHVHGTGGVPYGRFILPGLFAQGIVNVGFLNGTTSLFDARRDRYIHDVFASPLRWWEVNLAVVAGGVMRGLVVGSFAMVVAIPLTGGGGVARPLVLVLGTAGLLLVASQAGVIVGGLAKSMDHISAAQAVVLTPLTFLGGVFYSVDSLPRAWDVLSRFDPVFWLVQVERIGYLGHGDASAAAALGVVWALALVLSLWSAYIFGSGRLKA